MSGAPLPERIRPRRLDEVLGQDQLLGENGGLRQLLRSGHLPSILFWGPPGCGKTTIARLLAAEMGMHFQPFSAVLGGVPELRALIKEAGARGNLGQRTLLFIDEIHRFNKAQQDALLPHVEAGTVVLVGATTENPSFSVNQALLSRCRVLRLQALAADDLQRLVDAAADHAEGLPGVRVDAEALEAMGRLAAGDARRFLLMLEEAWAICQPVGIDLPAVAQVVQDARPGHDRAGDSHYDVASAFIKSMRASDVQAALFYLARQVEAGEDPRFIARRVVIFASEDVGLADPQALVQATACQSAVERIGLPEAIYPLSQAVIYCATAPKSNTTKSYFAAAAAVKVHPGAEVPLFLRNASTSLLTEMGHGEGYVYDHDTPEHFAGQACLPEVLRNQEFYVPGPFGFEREIDKRLRWWAARRK